MIPFTCKSLTPANIYLITKRASFSERYPLTLSRRCKSLPLHNSVNKQQLFSVKLAFMALSTCGECTLVRILTSLLNSALILSFLEVVLSIILQAYLLLLLYQLTVNASQTLPQEPFPSGLLQSIVNPATVLNFDVVDAGVLIRFLFSSCYYDSILF